MQPKEQDVEEGQESRGRRMRSLIITSTRNKSGVDCVEWELHQHYLHAWRGSLKWSPERSTQKRGH
jgi:hypothetical protein